MSHGLHLQYCLTSPTREEVDKAHAKGRWLDIGVMSVKNMMAVSKKRVGLFLLLGLSSPPLQFFYNSFLFQTWSINSYSAFVAHESFMTKPADITINLSDNTNDAAILEHEFGVLARHLHTEAWAGRLEKLGPAECIEAYAKPLQSNRRNVVVIADDKSRRSADVFDVYHAFVPTERPQAYGEQYSWVCDDKLAYSDQCLYHVNDLKSNSKNWTLSDDAKVQYCLSEKVEEHCKLNVSLAMAMVVLLTDLFKIIVMFVVATTVHDSPLMTTGDAISSFMRDPDPYTEGMCMASKRMIDAHPKRWPAVPIFVRFQQFFWAHTIKTRVAVCCLLFMLSISLNGALFCTVNEPIGITNFFKLGFGQINRQFFIGWHHKEPRFFVRAVFLANIGHAMFGSLYIVYSNVVYAMTFTDEWARYGIHRKGLRVSEAPRGSQRTVYFLLMPYQTAVPIMAFSVAIHGMISQTLFLIDVEAYGHDLDHGQGMMDYKRTPQFDFSTTGFSPPGNAAVIILGFALVVLLLLLSIRRLKSNMPVAGTCSAAISAACHPADDEPEDAYTLPIKWGETDIYRGIGHCAFSSRDVKDPSEYTPYM